MTQILLRRGIVANTPVLAAGEPAFNTDQFRFSVGSVGGNRLLGLFANIAGTVAPGVNDDAGAGYSVGSEWVDTTNAKSYICVASTVGAAVWKQTGGTGAGSSYTADETSLHLAGTVFSIKAPVSIANGGTGQTTAAAAFDALSVKATNVASAATTLIGAAAGRYCHITGTVTITAFDTVAAGIEREVEFDAALILTYSATALILPTSANITTAAGDTAIFVSEGAGNWRCLSYQRRDGTALVGGAGGSTFKISVGDTTADYGINKIVAGAGVTLTKLNPGANETLQVAASGVGSLIYTNTTIPAGNTLTSTTETAFASTYTLPASTLVAGDTIVIRLAGTYGGTVLPTIRGKVKFGATVMADTTAITGLVTGSGLAWFAEIRIIAQSIGATGSMEPNASLQFATAANAAINVVLANGATVIDTTATQAITVTIQWGAGGTGQTITLQEMIVVHETGGPVAAVTNTLLDGKNHTDTVSHDVVLGDLPYGNATPKWDALAGNTTTTLKVLTQTGTGSVSAAPVLKSLNDLSVPYWVPVVVSWNNAALNVAALTANVTIIAMPAKSVVHAAFIKSTTAFTATPGMTTIHTSLGQNAAMYNDIIMDSFQSWMIAVSDTYYQNSSFSVIPLYFSGTSVVSIFTADANLNTLTAGSLTYWLLISVLP